MDINNIQKIVRETVNKTVQETVPKQFQQNPKTVQQKRSLNEASIVIPKTFVLKTELLSSVVKQVHVKIYKAAVDAYNSVSSKLDSLSRDDAGKTGDSQFRRLKMDETLNLNAIKLHELSFANISDVHSEIRVDSLPYMRFSRDWGTFENWQFDFRACGLASNEGWVVCCYDLYKQKYVNSIVEGDTVGIPFGCLPVLVLDTHHHAWFRDYPGEKINYLNAMMKELNWSVIEARMSVVEKGFLHTLYAIQPTQTADAEKLIHIAPQNQPPISGDQVLKNGVTLT